MRIGHGYDVHRLTPGRRLVLGGVEIPHYYGLLGHSDADVLTHAVMDALLGAAGLGDIGHAFPDTDERFRDISSLVLLARVMDLVGRAGYGVVNVDATLVAQAPKLAPFLPQMKENLARRMGVLPQQVNLKATTEEGLGFTGGEQGMAAHAVCLLEERDNTKG